MTNEDIAALISRHGGLAGNPQPVDPTIDDPEDPAAKQKIPNPNPAYRYVFRDGTHFTARQATNGTYDVVDPGTALTPKDPRATPTPVDQLIPIKDPNTGQIVKLRDPATGTVIDLPNPPADRTAPKGSKKQTLESGRLITWVADGQGNWTVDTIGGPLNAPNEPKTPDGSTRRVLQGGYAVTEVYRNGTWTLDASVPPTPFLPNDKPHEGDVRQNVISGQVVQQTYRGGDWVIDPSVPPKPYLPSKPTQITSGLDQPYFVFTNPDDQSISTSRNPAYRAPAAQLFDNMYSALTDIQGLMEKGQMSPAEGQTYMDSIKAQTQSALRGTTPFAEAQQRQNYIRDAASTGRDILTNRVAQSSALAQALINSIKPRGENFDFSKLDPFALAKGFVNDVGGGQGVADTSSALVQSLLGGVQQGVQMNQLAPDGLPMVTMPGDPRVAVRYGQSRNVVTNGLPVGGSPIVFDPANVSPDRLPADLAQRTAAA
jgi:hypothetical protein